GETRRGCSADVESNPYYFLESNPYYFLRHAPEDSSHTFSIQCIKMFLRSFTFQRTTKMLELHLNRFGGASMIPSTTTTIVVILPSLSVSSRRRMLLTENMK
ncbi:hypothetical protein Avbf_10470, partial [Armadillidium vulgare]